MTEAPRTPSFRDRLALDRFDLLLDLDERERAAELERIERDDPELARALVRLLEADRTSAALLATPAPDGDTASGPAGELPREIGPWRVVARLGAGGMGEVFEVVREHEGFVQRAALKRLAYGRLDPAQRERFLRERQVLARLDHPSIARLIDGGVEPDGTPWLALELVAGEPITDAARRRVLDLRARLEAFLDICAAVSSAHRALVVHRDIKPANVLLGADGRVRLLDFGIAKLLDDDVGPTSLAAAGGEALPLTRHGDRPFTPAYASPEQIRGESITTATDVWALGALLHELLGEERPFGRPGSSRPEIEQAVLERPPERLFARGVPAALGAVGARLRRDLEAIVATALAKDPRRRYDSVDRLAADLRAALASRPIVARRETVWGRAARFVRRHAAASLLATLAGISLVAGLVATTLVARERTREAQKAAEIGSFLERLFEVASPEVSGGAPVSAREILAEGAARAEHELTDEPATRAALLALLARLHREVGDRERAVTLGESAVGAAIAAEGPASNAAAESAAELVSALLEEKRLQEAERLLVEAEARRPPLESPGAHDLSRARVALLAGQGRLAEAIAAARRILAATVARDGAASAAALADRRALAGYLSDNEELDEAERLQREIVAALIARHGGRHPAVARARHDLGITLGRGPRGAEAIAELEQAVAIHRATQGDAHWETVASVRELAANLSKAARYEAALERLAEAERALLAAGRQESFLYQNLLNDRALAYYQTARYGESAALFGRVAAAWSATLGPNHPHTLTALADEAGALAEQGRFAEAVPRLRELLARQRAISAAPASFASTLNTLGIALLDLDRPAEALPPFRESLDLNVTTYGEEHFATIFSHQLVARAHLALGEVAAAGPELAAARRAAATVYAADDRRYGALDAVESTYLLLRGDAAGALRLGRAVLDRRMPNFPATSWKVGEAHLLVAEALAASGERAAARASATRALEIFLPTRGEGHPLTRRARAVLAR